MTEIHFFGPLTAVLREWRVLDGDHVREDQILFVLEDDNNTQYFEWPSPVCGVISPLIQAGTLVKSGDIVAIIRAG